MGKRMKTNIVCSTGIFFVENAMPLTLSIHLNPEDMVV